MSTSETAHPSHAGVPTWTLSDRLRKARENIGLKQTELADEIGISRRSVTNYEVGFTTPGRPVLLSWAMRCGVPLTWLTTGDVPDHGPHNDDGVTNTTGDLGIRPTDHEDGRVLAGPWASQVPDDQVQAA